MGCVLMRRDPNGMVYVDGCPPSAPCCRVDCHRCRHEPIHSNSADLADCLLPEQRTDHKKWTGRKDTADSLKRQSLNECSILSNRTVGKLLHDCSSDGLERVRLLYVGELSLLVERKT